MNDPLPQSPEDQVRWALGNHRPAVVLFYGARCEPCSPMQAVLDSARATSGPVLLLSVDVDSLAGAELAGQLGVSSTPSWYLLTDGGSGTLVTNDMDEQQLRDALDRLVR